MRIRSSMALAAIAGIASATIGVQPAVADTQQCGDNATDCPVITHVEVSRSTVAVSSTALVPVTYTVGLQSRWSYGIRSARMEESPYSVPLLLLSWSNHAYPVPVSNAVGLHRVSGTAMDGDWQGTMYLPSTDAGTVVPAAVSFIANDDPANAGDYSFVPASMQVPTAVSGSHQPKLTIGFRTGPAGSQTVVVGGRVTDSGTGRPMPNVSVRIATGAPPYCLVPMPSLRAVTDADGVYAIRVKSPPSSNCVGIAGPRNSDGLNSVVWQRAVPRFVRPTVNFGPATSSVAAGGSLTLSGSAALDGKPLNLMAFGARPHVLLQRWIHRAWQTVGDGYTRTSGRFDLVASPSSPGNWSYRAVFPGSVDAGYWTVASRSVTVRAT